LALAQLFSRQLNDQFVERQALPLGCKPKAK
jgi:hypothetical protein